LQIFYLDEKLLHTIALSLNDFPEFNSIIALKWLLNVRFRRNKAGTSVSNPNVMCTAKSEKTTDRMIEGEGDYVKMEDIESEGIENEGDVRVIVNARYSFVLYTMVL